MYPYLEVCELSNLRSVLETFGWCVVRGVFSNEDVERAKHAVAQSQSNESLNGMTYGDSFATVSKVFHQNEHVDQILQVALRSERLVYFGDAVLRTDNNAGYKFHKDNILRESPSTEFDEPVSIVRCGWYLADHTQVSGGIAFQSGSHLRAGSVGFGCAAASRANDLVIWFTTTSHAANYQRIGCGDLVLPTSPPLHKLLSLVPRGFLQRRVDTRVTYLPTFASAGDYFDAYRQYISDREDYMCYVQAAQDFHNIFEDVLDPEIWTIDYPESRQAPTFSGHWEHITTEMPTYALSLTKMSFQEFL